MIFTETTRELGSSKSNFSFRVIYANVKMGITRQIRPLRLDLSTKVSMSRANLFRKLMSAKAPMIVMKMQLVLIPGFKTLWIFSETRNRLLNSYGRKQSRWGPTAVLSILSKIFSLDCIFFVIILDFFLTSLT